MKASGRRRRHEWHCELAQCPCRHQGKETGRKGAVADVAHNNAGECPQHDRHGFASNDEQTAECKPSRCKRNPHLSRFPFLLQHFLEHKLYLFFTQTSQIVVRRRIGITDFPSLFIIVQRGKSFIFILLILQHLASQRRTSYAMPKNMACLVGNNA